MDGRKNNKGVAGKAGRKSKAEEQALIEKLSPMEDLAHGKLKEALKEGKDWAIKMFFEYMYGKPKQVVDQKNTHEINPFNIKDIVSFKK